MSEKKARVVKSNELITASYPMTVREHRLLLAAISLIDSRSKMVNQSDREIVITADYYNKIFDVSNPYRDMRDAVKRLGDRWIIFENQKEVGRMRWVSEIASAKNRGHVRMIFSEGIAPFLTELTARFSTYEIHRVAKLTSAYSFRIFEMLIQYRSTGLVRMSIESLSERLCLPASYKRIGDLKMKVLDPAIEDLNTHSGLEVEYLFLPEGSRKKETVEFRFYDRWKNLELSVGRAEAKHGSGDKPGESEPVESETAKESEAQSGGEVAPSQPDADKARDLEEARANIARMKAMLSPLKKNIISNDSNLEN